MFVRPPSVSAGRPASWDDDGASVDQAPVKALTREQAQALRAALPPLSPWRVIATQAAVGVVASLVAGFFAGFHVMASMLYGVACVVLPAALLARGLASPLSRLSPTAAATSFTLWALIKLLLTLVMLVVANHIVKSPSWPALLAAVVLCINVHAWTPWWAPRAKRRG